MPCDDMPLNWDYPEAQDNWDEELEFRERCVDTLMNAVAEARTFLPAKDVLRLVIDSL